MASYQQRRARRRAKREEHIREHGGACDPTVRRWTLGSELTCPTGTPRPWAAERADVATTYRRIIRRRPEGADVPIPTATP
jgi:hypothetical protein